MMTNLIKQFGSSQNDFEFKNQSMVSEVCVRNVQDACLHITMYYITYFTVATAIHCTL